MADFNNAIVDNGVRPASEFKPNPQNWRRHPEEQKTALRAILRDIGWAGQVIVNRQTGNVVDGHARIELALEGGDGDVPYSEIDITPNQERILLSAYDPIGAMAETDRDALKELLDDVRSDDAGVQELLSGIAEREGITPPDFDPVSEDDQPSLDSIALTTCPECGHEF